MDKIKTKTIINIVHQFLLEEKLNDTAHRLELENAFFFNMGYFEELLRNKHWNSATEYVQAFTNGDQMLYSGVNHFIAKLEALSDGGDGETGNSEKELIDKAKHTLEQKLGKKLSHVKHEDSLLRTLISHSWCDILQGNPLQTPLKHEEWSTFFDQEGRVMDPSKLRKRIFYGGVAPDIREEVWAFLLGYHSYVSTKAERECLVLTKESEYRKLKNLWKDMPSDIEERWDEFKNNKDCIEKDVERFDNHITFFSAEDHRNTLRDILVTYTFYNYNLGYCQGMHDLLSPIFFVMRDEVKSFWCFVAHMERFKNNFSVGEIELFSQYSAISKLLQLLDKPLHDYIKQQPKCLDFGFCHMWVFALFKRNLDYEDMMRFWEVLWTEYPPNCDHFHLYVCVAILKKHCKKIMDEQMDYDLLLKLCNSFGGFTPIDIDEILRDAETLYNKAGDEGLRLIKQAYKESISAQAK